MKPLDEVPKQAQARFLRALERFLREMVLLRYQQTALKMLNGRYSVGADFFSIAQRGIYGDRLIRLVRLLEDDTDVASFWYLNRCAPCAVSDCLARSGCTLDEIADLSARVKGIRDRVFVHIDKKGLFNPEQIYRDANIEGSQIERVINGLWLSLNTLYETATGNKFKKPPEYDGSDIVKLNEFYERGFQL